MVIALRDDENNGQSNSGGTPSGMKNAVPLGVAVDDRPAAKPSRAATNDRADRTRAFMLIGGILALVVLLVILGNTALRPLISNQRNLTLERITAEQVDLLATIAGEHYLANGTIPTTVEELLDDERLETSDGRDLWGTPFVMHTQDLQCGDGVRLIVTSAGPDLEFGTPDDLVAERVLGIPAQDSRD